MYRESRELHDQFFTARSTTRTKRKHASTRGSDLKHTRITPSRKVHTLRNDRSLPVTAFASGHELNDGVRQRRKRAHERVNIQLRVLGSVLHMCTGVTARSTNLCGFRLGFAIVRLGEVSRPPLRGARVVLEDAKPKSAQGQLRESGGEGSLPMRERRDRCVRYVRQSACHAD